MKQILGWYEALSGQMINEDKTTILFSENTPEQCRKEVTEEMEIKEETSNEKYLGLPVHVGRSEVKVFTFLKERIWKKIQGWKEKMLSRAGKEVLIKAVAQSIPTYTMSCFDITRSVSEQINF